MIKKRMRERKMEEGSSVGYIKDGKEGKGDYRLKDSNGKLRYSILILAFYSTPRVESTVVYLY